MAYSSIFLLSLVLSSELCSGHAGSIMLKKCKTDPEKLSIDCSHQGFSIIPNSQFHADTRTIDLSSNSIQRVRNSTFASVRQLKTLDLSVNRIQYLEPMAFEGLERLECLNLSYNLLRLIEETFSATLFAPLKKLSTLRFHGHGDFADYTGIDKGFAMLTNLQELFMDLPTAFSFGDGFAKLTKLRTISTVSVPFAPTGTCAITYLYAQTFKVFENIPIIELRLSDCKIKTLMGNYKEVFSPLRNLSILDLSRNRLRLSETMESLSGLRGLNMEKIDFSMNYVGGPLREDAMIHLDTICVRCIDLSENGFTTDLLHYNRSMPSFGRHNCTEVLKISSHGISHIIDRFILSIITYQPLLNYLGIGGLLNRNPLTEVIRPFPPRENTSIVTFGLSNAMPMQILNVFYYFNFTQLKTLNISKNIERCNILRKMLPRVGTLTTLDISGMLCSDVYVSLPKGGGFQSLPDLQEIYISGNKLTDMQKSLFMNNTNLRLIDLSNNRMQRVPLAVMQPKNLSHLNLSINAFTHLTAEEMSLFDSFSRAQYGETRFHLSLENNPLQCTCDTLEFINWVYTTDVYLDRFHNYSCILSNGSHVSLSDFKNEIKNLSVSCISSTWLIIGVVCFLFVVLLTILFYVVYRYRTNLRYWLYTKLQPPVEMLATNEYVYEAFVAYTEDDYQWIYNDLCRIIENEEEGIKLCIHKRDFTAGKPIHENIVDKMRESRKIILAISVEFLKSPFGPLEIEYAGMKALEEGRDDLIICILLEDIPPREMPRALRKLWHKITFLTWCDDPWEKPLFWQRLKAAITDDRH